MRFSIFILSLTLVWPVAEIAAQDKPAEQSFRLAGMFANNMVLQQNTDAPIWGWTKPGESVEVKPSWSDETSAAVADQDGKWKAVVKTPAAGGPFSIEIRSAEEIKTLKNVLSGEVWICSGQSNMQWKMRGFGLDHWEEERENANHSQIRLCDVKQTIALQPQDDLKAKWSVCSSKTVTNFSAVGYFFGEQLHQELGVPIGLISSNWGGSSAEAWTSREVLESQFPEFDPALEKLDAYVETHGVLFPNGKVPKKTFNQRSPTVLYNQMIRPMVPYSVAGVIWYQGESNVKHPIQYRKLFPAMIKNWRDDWQNQELPFYFVQIAPFRYRTEPLPAALLREAQTKTLELPNTGMVVTMDIGDSGNIHPKRKKPVAQRLALQALAKTYGKEDLVCDGPSFSSHKIEGDQIRLSFENVGGGLASRDDKPLSHFQICGSDREFQSATVEIDGETILVKSENVSEPVAVRFAWGNDDEPNLMNKEGLPSSSFRTDDWEIAPKKIVRPQKKEK